MFKDSYVYLPMEKGIRTRVDIENKIIQQQNTWVVKNWRYEYHEGWVEVKFDNRIYLEALRASLLQRKVFPFNKQVEALLRAKEAMKVWTNLTAPEHCLPEHVKWANEQIKIGTLAYIARTNQLIIEALKELGIDDNNSDR